MDDPQTDLAVIVDIQLYAAEQGGRSKAINNGYRPLCIVRDDAGDETVIGLCQVELLNELVPGTEGRGTLRFAPQVSAVARAVFNVGTEFSLAEGRHVVGTARVVGR